MYIPRHFQEDNWHEIRKVIEEHSLATVVSCEAGSPAATHVPLRLVERAAQKFVLQGHMSRANQHWRGFEQAPRALAIFLGPDSYISPRWYDHVNVPTWNYLAVHVYGKPRLVNDPAECHQLMKGLVDRYEGHGDPAGRYTIESLPAEYLESQMNGIVGFEISVDEVQASFKLSQNRDERNHENILVELRKAEDQDAHGVAEAMACRRNRGSSHG